MGCWTRLTSQNTSQTLTRENAEMMVVDDCWLFGVESNPLFDPNNPETAMDLALMDGYPVYGSPGVVLGIRNEKRQPEEGARQQPRRWSVSKMQTAKSLPVIRDQQLVRHFR